MKRQLTVLPLVFSLIANPAFATGTTSDTAAGECEKTTTVGEIKNFPVGNLDEVAKITPETKKLGGVLPTPVATHNDKLVASSIPSQVAFFSANIFNTFATLDAKNPDTFRASLAIRYLEEYGLEEMRLLGPDLTKPNPFLDKASLTDTDQTPNKDKIDVTTASLAKLTEVMSKYIGADQKTALQNLLAGNFATSMNQVEAKTRAIMAKLPFVKDQFSGFLSDKKFLKDLHELFSGNYVQFEEDVHFMDELQSRYRKTNEALSRLSKEGETILGMKAAVLGTITDEYTKQQVAKAFDRFAQRVTDITAGIGHSDTYINVWEVIKDNHYELMGAILRTLNFTIPMLGANLQLKNALARQERTRKAIDLANQKFSALVNETNALLKKNTQEQQASELKQIEQDTSNLGSLLVGTMIVQEMMAKHAVIKLQKLEEQRNKYREISQKAREQRRAAGLD